MARWVLPTPAGRTAARSRRWRRTRWWRALARGTVQHAPLQSLLHLRGVATPEVPTDGVARDLQLPRDAPCAPPVGAKPTTILDRLLHHSHTLLIQGDSCRLQQRRR